jgi:5-methylcytosine-specific restriction endonuclease McrA
MPAQWEGSPRKSQLPADWRTIRTQVLERDGYRCVARLRDGERCPEAGNQVDHIERGQDHSLSNLQTLCLHHHKQKTAKEASAARGPATTLRRPTEQHPGLKW